MTLKLKNNSRSRLSASISAASTTIMVQLGHGVRFPATPDVGDWFPLALENHSAQIEYLRCTGRIGDALTVVRGQEGSEPRAYSAGDAVELRLTTAALQELVAVGGEVGFTYADGTPIDALRPAQAGATNTALPGTAIGTSSVAIMVEDLAQAKTDIDGLFNTYGSTASAAASASAAATSASTAQIAKDNVTAALVQATAARDAARDAEDGAIEAANASAQSQTNSTGSASSAAGSASVAINKASEAGTSASSASGSANVASSKADQAAGSASAASTSASSAATQASNSGNSASAAQLSRIAAESHASGNLVAKPTASDGLKGKWDAAWTTVVTDVADLPPDGSTHWFKGINRDIYERDWREGNYASRKLRVRCYARTFAFPMLIGVATQNAAGTITFVIPQATTTNVWTSVDYLITTPSDAVRIMPLVVSNGPWNDPTHDAQWSGLTIRDVTESELAAQGASAAATSASAASTYRDDAGSKAAAALVSATNANTSAGQASTSAGQASSSSSSAAGSASLASSHASNAANSSNSAGISAGAAAGSASTATTQAGLASQSAQSATSSAVTARIAASVSRPSGFSPAERPFWIYDETTQDSAGAAAYADNYFGPAEYPVFATQPLATNVLAQRAPFVPITGHRYRVTVQLARVINATNGVASVHFVGFCLAHGDGNFTYETLGIDGDALPFQTFVTRSFEWLCTGSYAWGRPRIHCNWNSPFSNAVFHVRSLDFDDITSEKAAQDAASAASTSASTASTKAGEAGNSALAAQNSSTTAATSAGQASTSAGQASSSASGAAGSASAALSSSTSAQSHRDTANYWSGVSQNAAAAAAGSSSTAASQASVATEQASSARTSSILAASISLGSLNPNPGFLNFPDDTAFPADWEDWGFGWLAQRITGENGVGYALRDAAAANQTVGHKQEQPSALRSIRPFQWLVAEVHAKLIAGTLEGAGCYVQFLNSGNGGVGGDGVNMYADPDSTGSAPGAGQVGKVYRWSQLIQAPANADRAVIVRMTNWEGWTGSQPAKTLDWYRCALRPATLEEIRDQTVLAPLYSQVQTNAGVLAGVNGRTQAYLENVVEAGGNRAVMRSTASGSGSLIGLRAKSIALGDDEDVLVIAGGKAYFLGDLIARSIKTDHLDYEAVTTPLIAPNSVSLITTSYSTANHWSAGRSYPGGFDEWGNEYPPHDATILLTSHSVYFEFAGTLYVTGKVRQSFASGWRWFRVSARVNGAEVDFTDGSGSMQDGMPVLGQAEIAANTWATVELRAEGDADIFYPAGVSKVMSDRRYK
ncbi:hypothetical protein LWE61_14990 [Sphingobium sufflavum]|uniref:hypothetical protein n=1 Tax=Sphingobium sufflavum TaxID=1129547 RepID=UPI001F259DC0|nr:hypothetical protein [Sphingobium sufflavum]MCE7797856.1 hypothetical protein [Sphingobium sufflavum]